MPNYDGRKPIEINCEHCGRVARHGDTKIDPKPYSWSDWATIFFKEKVGYDVTLRYITKSCKYRPHPLYPRLPASKCGKDFRTVELTAKHLEVVMIELESKTLEGDELQSKVAELEAENNRLKIELNQSNGKLHEVSDFALKLAQDTEVNDFPEKAVFDDDAVSDNSPNASAE